MKCSLFITSLPDWVRGKLAEADSEQMAQHASNCRACAAQLDEEKALQRQFASLAIPYLRADLWPTVAHRLEQTPRPVRKPVLVRWGLAGALAAVLVWSAFGLRPGAPTTITQAEELRVIRMVADMQPSGATQAELATYAHLDYEDSQRAVLIGSGGQ